MELINWTKRYSPSQSFFKMHAGYTKNNGRDLGLDGRGTTNLKRKRSMASFSMQILAGRKEFRTVYRATFNPAAKRLRVYVHSMSEPIPVQREGFSRWPVLLLPFVGKGKGKGDWLDPGLKTWKRRVQRHGTHVWTQVSGYFESMGESSDTNFTNFKKLKKLPQWGTGERQDSRSIVDIIFSEVRHPFTAFLYSQLSVVFQY
ncbi:uncharacterized protein EV420DRAFT_1480802 [Desarmillaria tabescens]|uniref:Uncharacterized protein n=1 Tax=Armillaria tabescens TaxID=1929756 RepID=A0AA39KA07_ARMTA|nr:uncharacterized protein EV420DRAFT_1480802 [Desarmillaria tabescens]KAK0457327.1 hypothetical protein EV420DRAFT_1480802 [Desarmillaria tabescens]